MNDKPENNKHTPLQQHIAERMEGIQITADAYEWEAHDWMSDNAHKDRAAKMAKKYRKAESALRGLPETGHAEGKQEGTEDLVTLDYDDRDADWYVAGGGVPDASYSEEDTDEAIDDFIYRLWSEGRGKNQAYTEGKKIGTTKQQVWTKTQKIKIDTSEPMAMPEHEENELGYMD